MRKLHTLSQRHTHTQRVYTFTPETYRHTLYTQFPLTLTNYLHFPSGVWRTIQKCRRVGRTAGDSREWESDQHVVLRPYWAACNHGQWFWLLMVSVCTKVGNFAWIAWTSGYTFTTWISVVRRLNIRSWKPHMRTSMQGMLWDRIDTWETFFTKSTHST